MKNNDVTEANASKSYTSCIKLC